MIPVSTEAGQEPTWSHDSTELYFRDGDRMMAVPWDTEQGTTTGRPQVLFEGFDYWKYDVAGDGRFLMIQHIEPTAQFTVVLNWHDELQRLVPSP